MPRKKKKSAPLVKPVFEDHIDLINGEIKKRRAKWNLTILNWMDYDDVSQIIRIHIFKKWHLYNPEKPLSPWLNRIITNQIKNLIRNNYGNFSRPCLKCAASQDYNLCTIYETQSEKCPLYSNWLRNKKTCYDAKLPVAIENHSQEVHQKFDDSFDVIAASQKLHTAMKILLKPLEWKVYKLLYIDGISEEEAAKQMGYKTTEKNRSPGYKQIKNVQKKIISKAKEAIKKGMIEI